MNGSNNWKQICEEIQKRSLKSESNFMTVKNAKELRARLLSCLSTANDEGISQTELQDIYKLLKITDPYKNKVQILGGGRKGGERNFNRTKDIPHFERVDGCWFDFTITVDEIPKPAEIIGFSFEIRFPDDYSVSFIRFDLNLPDHDNETRGMRFHIHPGSGVPLNK